jgi:hypothetical protein
MKFQTLATTNQNLNVLMALQLSKKIKKIFEFHLDTKLFIKNFIKSQEFKKIYNFFYN